MPTMDTLLSMKVFRQIVESGSSMFKDVLCPVLVEHPLRHPHLYALYVSRKHLPLKIRTFLDHLIEKDPHSAAAGGSCGHRKETHNQQRNAGCATRAR